MPHKRKGARISARKKLQQTVDIRNALAEEYKEEKRSNAKTLIIVAVMIVVAVLAAGMLGINLLV